MRTCANPIIREIVWDQKQINIYIFVLEIDKVLCHEYHKFDLCILYLEQWASHLRPFHIKSYVFGLESSLKGGEWQLAFLHGQKGKQLGIICGDEHDDAHPKTGHHNACWSRPRGIIVTYRVRKAGHTGKTMKLSKQTPDHRLHHMDTGLLPDT